MGLGSREDAHGALTFDVSDGENTGPAPALPLVFLSSSSRSTMRLTHMIRTESMRPRRQVWERGGQQTGEDG